MKFAVKVLGAACLFAGLAFAQEKDYEVSFTNELSTDTITSVKAKGFGAEKNSATVFAGIVEKAEAGFESEKLSFSVMGEWTFQPVKTVEDALDDNDVKGNQFILTDHDWFIEFRPIKELAIGWNDDLFVSGSSLPVWDDDIKAGNYTTNDGIALIARPVEGLSIGVGLDQSAFGLDNEDFKPVINLGANYSYQELFAVGVAIRNVAGSTVFDDDDNEEARKLTFGAFASITAVENLVLNVGFTHNDYEGIDFGLVDPFEMFNILGQNVATLGATYEANGLSLAADVAFNFNGADDTDEEGLEAFAEADGNRYDAYFGLCAEYAITEQITAGLTGLVALDLSSNDDVFEDKADLYFAVGPAVKYAFNDHNEFSVGVNFEKAGSDYQAMNIPLSWTYNF
ncbi:MAG: transporter [Treponema sp.]|nr:transporter [Treponema sp.]